ncbi:hypothetical protein Xcel_3007 [Xylanimonas cellulosilytica DSM 15894]|uniref:RAMA domain-containing protein n=1 Tax=Xylanimonas cellulosilytica (strain DSM 15894 / JCM 12276 / CECT 5975 / KCTC 9989 / LMG 20990 / NBRC 107835 / XIL07) TaxID=446471 RepID=D1BZB6_XYLCX|nr:hypothetical protein [Xylanimonas cellulosilytica]ACZ32013.1 hypothetical protein Xcel_3007 [Xylanimonas cellulosilytica DSM 15894]
MPLFEVEGDRPQIVPGPRPGVGTTAHRVVESHIDGLLGEQIFPVAPGSGPDEPHLLALDASGAPVVVELVARLDDAALSRALDHAGAAGRMTRGQLASLYRGGPQAFQRDVAEFYDSVPVQRSQPGRTGVRLIVICQDADEDVLNAVDFLRQPSMPVEVLRLGLVHGADGRRFVDVSPLVIHPASAPDRPELVARPEGVAPLTSLSAKAPVVVQEDQPQGGPVPLPGAPAALAAAPTPSPAPAREPAPAPEPTPTPVQPEAVPPAPPTLRTDPARRSARRRSRTDRFAVPATPVAGVPAAEPPVPPVPPAPSFLDEPYRLPRDLDLGPASPYEDPLAWRPSQAWDPQSGEDPVPAPSPGAQEALAFGEVFSVISGPLDPGWDGVAASSSDHVPWEPPYEPPRLADAVPPPPAPAPWWEPEPQPQQQAPMVLDEDADADLAALAARFGVPTALVWERPRRGQRYDATLHPDGTLELYGGGRYRHPDVAASAASGSYTADGWTVWRVAATGETLAEAFRARFA